ncbi:MAG: ornithine cyclodeaminase family protein [Pseudomonadota bacterium]
MTNSLHVIDSSFVRANLSHKACIDAMRKAMIAFSTGKTQQHLRTVLSVGEHKVLGIMPGAMDDEAVFGAKLISVFSNNFDHGKPSHQGLIVLFEAAYGAPICVVDAGTVTAIRTAAASAAATDALAREDANSLALLGYGEQAYQHALAINEIRDLKIVKVWGRSHDRSTDLAKHLSATTSIDVEPVPTAREAVASADIICTVTSAQDPILFREWVMPGAHINAVGSSIPGPAEIDNALVKSARFVADSRAGVVSQGGEFLRAKKAGLINDDHIIGEIGDVFAGSLIGRQSVEDITIYKSLGHIVQDLAAASLLRQLWTDNLSS